MRRLCLILIALFLLFAMTAGVGAQEDSVSLSATLGSEATLYPYFADYSWVSLSLDYFGFTMSSTTGLSYASPFSVSQIFGLAYTWNWLTLGSKLYMGVIPLPIVISSVIIYTQLTMFDIALGNPSSFSGGLGASATVYPTVAANEAWFDLSLQVDGFSIASKTTFALMPFGFSQQRVDLGYAFDGLAIYLWGALSATWDPSGGIGFTISFP